MFLSYYIGRETIPLKCQQKIFVISQYFNDTFDIGVMCTGDIFFSSFYIGSAAAEVPAKFQSDGGSLNPNLVASMFHEILLSLFGE